MTRRTGYIVAARDVREARYRLMSVAYRADLARDRGDSAELARWQAEADVARAELAAAIAWLEQKARS